MKIKVTLKDPDGFSESVAEAVRDSLKGMELAEDEIESLFETRLQNVWDRLRRFVEYQEYVTIEFDTEAGTATVELNK